ncbi:hypothetical protein [Luedemannella helvata]|uniref:Uncharacterized protein n=1 Tax=Luedemannella helvata TaxID=349315 RepID=A0ABP4W5X6_9ACTN
MSDPSTVHSSGPLSSGPLSGGPFPGAASRSRGGLIARVIWEALLLIVAVVAVAVALADAGERGATALFLPAGVLAAYAVAIALSLRTATPNLAVTAIGALSGLLYSRLLDSDDPMPVVLAAALAVAAAALLGLVLALLVGVLSVPAWAASLAVVGGAQAVLVAVNDGRVDTLSRDGVLREEWIGYTVLAVVLLASIAGGLLWAVPGVRRALSANRVAGDPVGFSGRRILGALVGLVGSSILGGLAGVLFTARVGAASGVVDFGTLILALSAVLLGGVSVYGGRGGFAGTAFAVVIIAAIQFIINLEGGPRALHYGLAALAALVGFLVGRLLEFLEGPFDVAPAGMPASGPAAVPASGPAAVPTSGPASVRPAPGGPTLTNYAPVPFSHMPPQATTPAPPATPSAPPATPSAPPATPSAPPATASGPSAPPVETASPVETAPPASSADAEAPRGDERS